MKEAIKLAMGVGYDIQRGRNGNDLIHERLWCDETFWQALGKAEGWGKNDEYFENRKYDYWQLVWHRFIDHLAEGKDAESFFTSLLSPNKKDI